MKRMIVLVLMLVPFLTFPQEKEKAKKLTREERKEKKEQEEKLATAKVHDMVMNKEWVIEVTALMDTKNNHGFINSANNYVAVKQNAGVIQLNLEGLAGWNGIGGTTLKGKVENYEVKDPDKEMYVTGTINTGRGAFTFRMYPSIYKTKIVLSGSFNDTVTLIGNLISPDETVLFEGVNVYN